MWLSIAVLHAMTITVFYSPLTFLLTAKCGSSFSRLHLRRRDDILRHITKTTGQKSSCSAPPPWVSLILHATSLTVLRKSKEQQERALGTLRRCIQEPPIWISPRQHLLKRSSKKRIYGMHSPPVECGFTSDSAVLFFRPLQLTSPYSHYTGVWCNEEATSFGAL